MAFILDIILCGPGALEHIPGIAVKNKLVFCGVMGGQNRLPQIIPRIHIRNWGLIAMILTHGGIENSSQIGLFEVFFQNFQKGQSCIHI